MKRFIIGIVLIFAAQSVWSQMSYEEYRKRQQQQYGQYKQQQHEVYKAYRKQMNDKYAEFMAKRWEVFQAKPAVVPEPEPEVAPIVYEEPVPEPDPAPEPKQTPVPEPKQEPKPDPRPAPTPIPESRPESKPESKPLPIKEEIVVVPAPTPAPEPIAPVEPVKELPYKLTSISFYGTLVSIGFPESDNFKISGLKETELAEAWKVLSDDAYSITVNTVLGARTNLKLCDWGFLQLIKQVTEKHYGKTNEAVFMQVYLMTQAGYRVRMATADNHLYVLVSSQYDICNMPFYVLDGHKFFSIDGKSGSINICQAFYEKEKSISLQIATPQKLSEEPTNKRTLSSNKGLSASVTVNKNLIDFYNTYPSGYINGDVTTRWAAYANTPLEQEVKNRLYPTLKKSIEKLSEKEAVGLLLNWVQTAFVYEYDDKVWGGDRAFFATETLYYPYCDCEDRSILFSRLVRDLIGLPVVLLYYPGHLATAVAFKEDVQGDYITVKNKKYIVCDPTYINAGVGRTMPDMNNKQAQAIILN